ncbi:uncharacterized protein LOC144909574 [Branchiostoma floridae x Branchiostoma belcheri]
MAGTKCGQDKVCYNNRCELITALFPNVTTTTASWWTPSAIATQTTTPTQVTPQQTASSTTGSGQTGVAMTTQNVSMATQLQTTPQGSGWWIDILPGTKDVLVFFLVFLLAILPVAGLVYFFCRENKAAVKKRVKTSRMSKYMADFKAKKSSSSDPESYKRRKSSQKPMMADTMGSLNAPRLRLPVVWQWRKDPGGNSASNTNVGVVPSQVNDPQDSAPSQVNDPEDSTTTKVTDTVDDAHADTQDGHVDFTGIVNPNYNMVTIDLDETSTAEA